MAEVLTKEARAVIEAQASLNALRSIIKHMLVCTKTNRRGGKCPECDEAAVELLKYGITVPTAKANYCKCARPAVPFDEKVCILCNLEGKGV